jgi:N-methylhydantoinase B
VFGGKPASLAVCRLVDSNLNNLKIGSKFTRQVNKGDTITLITSGGGGWGNPLDRDPEKVRWDVIEGLVSKERAQSEYGVVLNDQGEIDWNVTKEIRTKMAKD